MCGIWTYLLTLAVLSSTGVYHAVGIELSTSKEVTAKNGTDVVLKCTFQSSQPISKMLSVSWSFRPLGQTNEEAFFFYQETPFPPTKGRFMGHVLWSGNVLKSDASITLQNVQFSFNGTYSCQVRNPPDVHGYAGEINLQVVQSVKLNEIGLLAAAVGGAIGFVLILLVIYLAMRHCRKRREEEKGEMAAPEWKQEGVLTAKMG